MLYKLEELQTEQIKPESLNSHCSAIKEKGHDVCKYGIKYYQLYLISKHEKDNICPAGIVDEPTLVDGSKGKKENNNIFYYYNSGDPSCILSRMDCFDNPYRAFLGCYNKFLDKQIIFLKEELTRDQVSLVVTASKEYLNRNK